MLERSWQTPMRPATSPVPERSDQKEMPTGTSWPSRRLQAELVARRGLAALGDGLPHVVEIHPVAEDRLPRLIDRLVRPDSGDRLRRPVEGGDLPGRIHADEPGADRLEDQVPERLEIREMLALILHVLLELVIAPRQGAGEDGDRAGGRPHS